MPIRSADTSIPGDPSWICQKQWLERDQGKNGDI